MYKFLKWVSVLAFLSAFGLVVAGIWNAEMKLIWISVVTLLFSGFSSGYAESVKKQDDATLF